MIELLSILVLLLLGLVLHELTHIVTIYPISEDIRVNFDNGFEVEYDYFETDFKNKYAMLSNISPSIIGLSILSAAAIFGVMPQLSLESLGLYLGAISYSVGGPQDYLF